MSTSDLTAAFRPYPARGKTKRKRRPPKTPERFPWPGSVLLIDTETTIDPTQRLTCGSYRHCRWTKQKTLQCVEEGLFYADDLPESDPEGFERLQQYVAEHRAEVAKGQDTQLHLYSRREFMDKVFWRAAYQARALVVGFNLPFDLSRLAVDVGIARGWLFHGGFSFVLWDYFDKASGRFRENFFRPRLRVKHLDSKRAFIGFGAPARVDPIDEREAASPFRGHFLDLRTLAFALTNESHSLASACDAFGVPHGKATTDAHGSISEAYIDYNRRDVLASAELLEKLRAEFDRHPIHLDPCKAFSPATVAKAYHTAMGLIPPMAKFSMDELEVLGYAMTAYYGGRAEARIRGTVVPVVYCDFLSMYPTVNTLLGLWDVLTARDVEIVDVTDEVRQLLETVTVEACFERALWREFGFFALVEPDGDILPLRARYEPSSGAFNIGVNPVTSETPLWYAGPDLVASLLLTGRPPKIQRAFRVVPHGQQRGLRSVRLRGTIPVDPRSDDFFRTVVEARRGLGREPLRSEAERERLDHFLKVLANSGSYGLFAEINRRDARVGEHLDVEVYGLEGAFSARTTAEETPGRFCFPLIAALITAGARLMLALLERCVADLGGTYAFCDTDSMAIVATESGGLVPCPGGPEILPGEVPSVRALSWDEVGSIITHFEALNPYDRDTVQGSVLEMEHENFDEHGNRQQLYAYVISAKRYALFTHDSAGCTTIRKHSEHGLGHLLNPTDPDSDDRDWIRQLWDLIIREALGESVALPAWLDQPAVSRLTISSPLLYQPFAPLRPQVPYRDRIKPMNFVLSVSVAPLGHPAGADPRRFHLIAPYTPDPRAWFRQPWADIYSGERYGITTSWQAGGRIARVNSYRDVLQDYQTHPEPKSADIDGKPCGRTTMGLLQRRAVRVGVIEHIGKESNRVEEVEEGLVHDWDAVVQVYSDPRQDPWVTLVVPVLNAIPRPVLAEQSGLSERTIRSLGNRHSLPHPKNRALLTCRAVQHAHRIASDRSTKPEHREAAERLLRSPLGRRILEELRRSVAPSEKTREYAC